MTDQISGWLSNTLQAEGFAEYEIRRTGNTGKSDGYLGLIFFVTVNGVTKDKQPKRLDLVLKVSKDNAYLKENTTVVSAFLQEMLIYEKVLPTFDAFQKEKGVVDIFKSYPKCYKCLHLHRKEVIVLQNLKSLGFELHDRKKTMNFRHARAVLREYGKLHAISFALKDQREEIFNALAGGCKDLFMQFLSEEKSRDAFNGEFKKVLDLLKEFGEHELYDKFKRYETCAVKTFMDVCEANEPQSSFAHGDCWNNNFMFKYKVVEETYCLVI
ncbi:unnamed protein product [Acanthoscelides obtectus]|uniref:CHK kinase-like domain-containing protein n=1 Tax=Acanthoscelides obtectus TaxID=200917 RepID=A0A9P0MDR9_ACAOB|nr:unnamed protein product [Acanthoscelides obtectus]CAK1677299.1 hypothetical protein AOBTE_LOCUS31234 [Acanthoscelides obtectus]